jgi:LL-H family phage holin
MHDYVIDILVFVITVLGIILTKNVIPYIKTLIKTSDYADIYDIVEVAVKAAEQKCTAKKQGKAKKADVYNFVSRWLDNKGIHITEDELDRLIEAAVYSMNTEV